MAKKVFTFDFGAATGNRPTKYPWDEWLDGSIWKLAAGEDFTTTPASIRTYARLKAGERGMKLKTRIVDGDIYIQAVKA